jgi:dTMP kinase
VTDGLYIAIEGVEGAGKSTQAALLFSRLANTMMTREPGGTDFGGGLRSLLLHGEDIDPRTEAMLMTADRLETYNRVVRPCLEAGLHMITDRSYLSMIAYQAYGRDLGFAAINSLYEFAWTPLPDIVVLLDIEPEAAFERMRDKSKDRFERLGPEFFDRVRAGYEECARRFRDLIVRVDGDGSIPEVADAVYCAVQEHSNWQFWMEAKLVAGEEPPHPQPLTWVLRDHSQGDPI